MKRLFRDYGLSIVLAVLFLVSWAVQTVMGWYDFKAEQREHAQAAQWFGADGYLWHWGEATFENWQSEFLQLLTFVVLTSFLIHKGSAESKDSDDELRQGIERLEQRLDAIQRMSPQEAHDRAPGTETRVDPGGTRRGGRRT